MAARFEKGALEFGDGGGEFCTDRTVAGCHRFDQCRVGLAGGLDLAGTCSCASAKRIRSSVLTVNPCLEGYSRRETPSKTTREPVQRTQRAPGLTRRRTAAALENRGAGCQHRYL
ncbi:hypothetical protein I553_3553 [Mycobacterium xenopi 4042]|uniref:Uncharacterized protein n=1 Tax=Mycobacterium xenopi 4042 TaxID=1299334 RepID=X8ALS2_MYCXE|nr:hypothetical protein I553_3553 [Mycobacterium xenopi 4042]